VSDKDKDELVICGDHMVHRSEVTVDDEGQEIHGKHFFPSGIPRKTEEPRRWGNRVERDLNKAREASEQRQLEDK